ncbi:tRNA (guanine(26)-N(2))-dimethyltransferase-like [Saccostrea echinata]|uniref:tRNA (guanine(26)-N(2))-dimethyltransferase-like n=1 Tax=Saccostrea echinata TaxID=191078 RepID=UPI002A7F508E|nr:tRNA (guanine(26)-N(2))-dimethyltransferase-like [Saccostrea echinata]
MRFQQLVKFLSRFKGRRIRQNLDTTHMETKNLVKEGKAEVLYPPYVFYNPVQEFNRDLTIAVISQFAKEKLMSHQGTNSTVKNEGKGSLDSEDQIKSSENEDALVAGKCYDKGLRVLEGLAASGLRSVRFGLEIPGVKEIVANDFDKSAVEIIKKNIELNKMEHLIKANYGDAAMVMYQNREKENRFDVIDLDPYGSPHLFLDAAVQAVSDGGLLCITCTDAAVLCGNTPETCHSKYGSVSLRTKYCHEMALRIILRSVESHANRYSRYTEPLLSVSVDFYFRVFVRVYSGQGKVKRSLSKLSTVYHCVGCGSFQLQRMGHMIPTKGVGNYKYTAGNGPVVKESCENCGFRYTVGGPVWAEEMHYPDFVQRVIDSVEKEKEKFKTAKRIVGMLSVIKEELHDIPFYYTMDGLCGVLHCEMLSFPALRSAFLNSGHRVSLSHCAKDSIKTDAPSSFVWDVMRAWTKEKPVKERHLQDNTPCKAILSKPCTNEVSFELHPNSNPESRLKGLTRWQTNPEKNWGPKPRAKRKIEDKNNGGTTESKKAKENQHVASSSDGEKDSRPCRHFQRGRCKRGDSCKFVH